MGTVHLNLDHLAVGYQGKALIHGIEIGVQKGEIVTLVGPNGSGKSTILKTITRQLMPVHGDIFLAEGKTGEDSCLKKLDQYGPGELARQMAVMLTARLQTDLMTCRDVTAMGRYPYTGRLGILQDVDEQKVEEALAAVHAQHLADRPFDAVSDGERQRILLSRAICQEPAIIVLDEPTSYLDIRHKLELLDILYKMSRQQGITVLMSLHEIDLAMKISDRVICVRGEEIFACGKPSQILNDDTVRRLYDLDPELGRFDARTGSLELFFADKASDAENMAGRESAPDIGQKTFAGTNADTGQKADEETVSDTGQKTFAGANSDTGQKRAAESVSIPRAMIAAPGSGSGKTLITCGLLRLLQRKNLQPAAFKCGPDYIDPMFHRQVLGIPSRNLDTFFSPGDSNVPGNTAGETMARAVAGSHADLALIEGVMGYFDGTGTSGMEASSFDLAHQTDTPVILAVNARGMSRSIVPLLKGFADYEKEKSTGKACAKDCEKAGAEDPGKAGAEDPGKAGAEDPGKAGAKDYTKGNCVGRENHCKKENGRIRGVILNRITAGMYPRMKKWIEEDASLKVIGYLPQDDSISWGSRHLGLLQPEEVSDLQGQIDHLADILEKTVDLEALLDLMGTAPPLQVCGESGRKPGCNPGFGKNPAGENPSECRENPAGENPSECRENPAGENRSECRKNPGVEKHSAEKKEGEEKPAPAIAVARDEAFNFYYEDNLELLQECGAKLVFFSPLHDREVPEADGLLLGGGYPELHAGALADNETMKESIRACAAGGMPILAECGGFMYLQQTLEMPGKDGEPGKAFPMCGVLSGTCRMTDRLVRFGYIELEKKDGEAGAAGYLQDGHRIRGHEFHYFDSTDNGGACRAHKPGQQRSWDCMAAQGNILAGFPHLYYRSDPEFARAFVERCRQFSTRK